MSFYVADESLRAASLWLSYYKFQDLDYGSKELNEYAKTLPVSFFAYSSLNRNARPSYSNSSDVTFRFDYPGTVTYTILYIARGDGYFKVKRGDKILPGWFRTEQDLANHLKSLFTDRIVAKHLAPAVKHSYERYSRFLKQEKDIERRAFEADPKNWSREKRIAKYQDLTEYLEYNGECDQRSDCQEDLERYYRLSGQLHSVKEAMTEEEIKAAEKEMQEDE